MYRLIHHYAAALGRFAPAPVRRRIVLLVARPRHRRKYPLCALVRSQRAQFLVGFEIAILKAHAHHSRATRFGGFDRFVLLAADTNRLFAKHVYAAVERRYAHARVFPVRRADMHYVRLRFVEHFFVIVVYSCRRAVLIQQRLRLFLTEVAYRDEVQSEVFYYVYMRVCDCSATYYSGFHFLLRVQCFG